MTVVTRIVENDISRGAAESHVAQPEYGALVSFEGSVRSASRDSAIIGIDYEAYRPLADKELQRIAEEAAIHWEASVSIVHRVGYVSVGELSIVIAIGTTHRDAAFEACSWCLQQVKQSVPIWKREHYAGGTRWIEGDLAIEVSPNGEHGQ